MILKTFDRYILKNLGIATLFVAMVLAGIIMLTQSLRFLELIINSGASSFSFFALTLLALPRFFEVILPIALMIGIVFIYNKMISDSEMVVMRSSGFSPLRLARPALIMAILTAFIVFLITAWIAPVALSKMQVMRVTIKTQYSNLFLKEGVFNQVGRGLTVYIGARAKDGNLENLLIHDTRIKDKPAVTVLAKRGVVVIGNEKQEVVVYDGSRQQYNLQKNILERLDFKRYSLELPEPEPVRQRWREPDERTLFELLKPAPDSYHNDKSYKEFRIETHRRFISPFLALAYSLVALCCLLLGDLNRRGLSVRIVAASGFIIMLQGFYLLSYNAAKENVAGLILMYGIVFVPIILGYYLLCPQSDKVRLVLKRTLVGIAR